MTRLLPFMVLVSLLCSLGLVTSQWHNPDEVVQHVPDPEAMRQKQWNLDMMYEDEEEAAAKEEPAANGTWQTGTTSVRDRTSHLLDSELHSDVTLFVGKEKKTFKAHRLVLAMSSPVLEKSVYGDLETNINESIDIPEAAPEIFQKLLDYIYKDDIQMTSMPDTWDLWSLANRFQLTHLVQKTGEFISTGLIPTNALQSLKKAVFYNETKLEERCLQFIDKHADDVLRQMDFFMMPDDFVVKILSRSMLQAKEVDIFKAAMQWAKTSLLWKTRETPTSESLREQLSPVLPHIYFDIMTPDEFVSEVIPHGILTHKELSQHLAALLKKMLPTEQISKTRNEARQVACKRWISTELRKDAPTENHIIKFQASCSSTCSFIGLRVTELFQNYGRRYRNTIDLSISITCTIQVLPTKKEMYKYSGELSHPYDLIFDDPIVIKKGTVYAIQLRVENFSANNYGMQYCSECSQKTSCGRVEVEFFNHSDSQFTSAHKGLISQLYFIN